MISDLINYFNMFIKCYFFYSLYIVRVLMYGSFIILLFFDSVILLNRGAYVGCVFVMLFFFFVVRVRKDRVRSRVYNELFCLGIMFYYVSV